MKIYGAHIFELGCLDQEVYLKDEVDGVLAEKDGKIESLEKELARVIAERDGNQTCIDALNTRLEDVQNTYKESVEVKVKIWERCKKAEDTLVETEHRLKRALYKACANWALSTLAWLDCIDQGEPKKWSEMRQKCLAKAEQAKTFTIKKVSFDGTELEGTK